MPNGVKMTRYTERGQIGASIPIFFDPNKDMTVVGFMYCKKFIHQVEYLKTMNQAQFDLLQHLLAFSFEIAETPFPDDGTGNSNEPEDFFDLDAVKAVNKFVDFSSGSY